MLGRIGIPELVFIFLIVILLFGAKSIPEIARGLANGIKLFKKELQGISDDAELSQVRKDTDNSLKPDPDPISGTKQKTSINKTNDFDPDRPRRDWRSESSS